MRLVSFLAPVVALAAAGLLSPILSPRAAIAADGGRIEAQSLLPANRGALGAEIDAALTALAAAGDPAGAARARERLDAAWRVSGSAATDLLTARAEAAVVGGEIALAMDLLDAAIVLSPDFPRLRTVRAGLHQLRGETGPAIVDLEVALTVEPRHLPSLAMLAAIREGIGDKVEALVLLRRAARLDLFDAGLAERLRRLTIEVEGHDL